ncbi:silent information regulator protein Sir2, partial [Enterococcus faecalis]
TKKKTTPQVAGKPTAKH